MSDALEGHRILLTRSEGQVETIAARLRERGAKVRHFPAIRITLTHPDPMAEAIINQATFVIFVSVNAVQGLMAGPDPLTRSVRHASGITAIGPATTQALAEVGLEPDLVAPPPYSSEALLSTAKLRNLKHRQIVIVRGQGGREALAEKLRRRGAEVRYLEVYRRDLPAESLSLEGMPGGAPEVVCVTSVEIAKNLLRCVAPGEEATLRKSTLIVGNTRIANACRKLGYTAPAEIADNPGDDAMIDALTRYFAALPHNA